MLLLISSNVVLNPIQIPIPLLLILNLDQALVTCMCCLCANIGVLRDLVHATINLSEVSLNTSLTNKDI